MFLTRVNLYFYKLLVYVLKVQVQIIVAPLQNYLKGCLHIGHQVPAVDVCCFLITLLSLWFHRTLRRTTYLFCLVFIFGIPKDFDLGFIISDSVSSGFSFWVYLKHISGTGLWFLYLEQLKNGL